MPAAQSRRMPERALGLLLTIAEGGGWASAPRQHIGQGGNTLKAVADEAGGGYTCGTIAEAPVPRMHVTERLLTSACAALNLHSLSIHAASCQHRAQRDGVGAGCGRAAGQVSWGRVGSVGRFDGPWHTDGRPFVRGAHQRHGAAWQVASRPCRFEYAKGMQL